MNVRIPITADQRSHGLGGSVFCFYFNRDQCVRCSDEKVLLQWGIIPLVVIERISGFDQRLTNHIFAEGAFTDPQIFVGTQILLRLLVQHCHKQAAVRKIEFALGVIIVALKRKLWEIQAIADIDHTCVIQPLNAPAIIPEAGAGSYFGNLELFVVFRQLYRDMVEHIEYSCLACAFGIFLTVLFVVGDQLPLDLKGAFKGAL